MPPKKSREPLYADAERRQGKQEYIDPIQQARLDNYPILLRVKREITDIEEKLKGTLTESERVEKTKISY